MNEALLTKQQNEYHQRTRSTAQTRRRTERQSASEDNASNDQTDDRITIVLSRPVAQPDNQPRRNDPDIAQRIAEDVQEERVHVHRPAVRVTVPGVPVPALRERLFCVLVQRVTMTVAVVTAVVVRVTMTVAIPVRRRRGVRVRPRMFVGRDSRSGVIGGPVRAVYVDRHSVFGNGRRSVVDFDPILDAVALRPITAGRRERQRAVVPGLLCRLHNVGASLRWVAEVRSYEARK